MSALFHPDKAETFKHQALITPFPEALVGQWIENKPNSEVYSLDNKVLVKRLSDLSDKEITWLFNQEQESVIINIGAQRPLVDRILKLQGIKPFTIVTSNLRQNETARLTLQHVLFPSLQEYVRRNGVFSEGEALQKRLVFGMLEGDETQLLTLLRKEKIGIKNRSEELALRINKPKEIEKICCFLAHKATQTVLFSQAGQWSEIDNETAQRYILLLEQIRYVYRLESFHSNLKHEFKKGNRIVFSDNGLLNAHLQNFNSIENRMDIDSLWKNWLMSERIKRDLNSGLTNEYFFWQAHYGQGIDFIVKHSNESYEAFIFNWNSSKKHSPPPLFKKYYPHIPIKVINTNNYLSFLIE